MPDLENQNHQAIVLDLVHDPPIAYADAKETIAADKPDRAGGKWALLKACECAENSFADRRVKAVNGPFRGRRDLDTIGH